ncbi:MAG: hypothetical protein M3355_12110 [Actinomycetota bacterium]|nr:hypothetical protein [Actinomycetota bacterium]
MPQVKITLGDHEIPVVPQRVGYIAHKLDQIQQGDDKSPSKADVKAVQEGNAGTAQLYRVLCAMVPQVEHKLPEHEFAGFASAEAYEKKDYDPEADRSPLLDEIFEALETAVMVNGGERVRGFLGPKMLQNLGAVLISEVLSDS